MASTTSQKTLVFVTSLDGDQNMRYSWQYFLQKPSQRYDSETTVESRICNMRIGLRSPFRPMIRHSICDGTLLTGRSPENLRQRTDDQSVKRGRVYKKRFC
jgi:hypothetical protein